MTDGKQLGKITAASFGTCYDRPFLLGIWLTLGGKSWGVCVNYSINMSPECKWESKSHKHECMDALLSQVNKLLEEAKVNNVADLVGKPIELASEGWGAFINWDDFRILTEVL